MSQRSIKDRLIVSQFQLIIIQKSLFNVPSENISYCYKDHNTSRPAEFVTGFWRQIPVAWNNQFQDEISSLWYVSQSADVGIDDDRGVRLSLQDARRGVG